MAEESGIDWLRRGSLKGATWNPWLSCQHATYLDADGKEQPHPGCLNCYAEALMDTRYAKCVWGASGNRVKTAESNWAKPGKWNAKAAEAGVLLPVFPSLCDPFEEWLGPIVDHNGSKLWKCQRCGAVIPVAGPAFSQAAPKCCDHTYPLLMESMRADMLRMAYELQSIEWILFTKRPQNVPKMWIEQQAMNSSAAWAPILLPNVTLCYSASDQATLNWGQPLIVHAGVYRAGVIGISAEPFLGPMDFHFQSSFPEKVVGKWRRYQDLIGWVVIGVESNGPKVGRLGAFANEAEWWLACEETVRQCQHAGVPVYVKQGPVNGRVSHDPAQWPEACRVREFPKRAARQPVPPMKERLLF
jgi:hypothetical protein